MRNEARRDFLNSQPRQTGRPPGQRSTINGHGQRSNFPNFIAFSCLVILPLPFSVEIPNFLCPMPREFDFLSKFDLFPRIISI